MVPIYYTIEQIQKYHLTDLKYRMIKYRLKLMLSSSNILQRKLAYKKGQKWFIHYSLLDKFQAIRKHKSHSLVRYENELTINFDSNYDQHFYHHIGSEILIGLEPNRSTYVIEASASRSDSYHIHFATTASYSQIYEVLSIIEENLALNIIKNKNTHLASIKNRGLYHNYIHKAIYGMGMSN